MLSSFITLTGEVSFQIKTRKQGNPQRSRSTIRNRIDPLAKRRFRMVANSRRRRAKDRLRASSVCQRNEEASCYTGPCPEYRANKSRRSECDLRSELKVEEITLLDAAWLECLIVLTLPAVQRSRGNNGLVREGINRELHLLGRYGAPQGRKKLPTTLIKGKSNGDFRFGSPLAGGARVFSDPGVTLQENLKNLEVK